jgi:O-acetyl-ADP-ribose deacetylase (regulator of RNase III)
MSFPCPSILHPASCILPFSMTTPESASATINRRLLELVIGDITQHQVDAIVNAANSRLAGGGGVDGAIHRAAGPSIMDETARRYPDGCSTGSAVITSAGNLQAKYVIHAVGPVWGGGNRGEEKLLASAYRMALDLAAAHDCRSIALPALSAGAYGYPLDQAGRVAIRTAIAFLRQLTDDSTLSVVRFVLFSSVVFSAFRSALDAEPDV